MLKAAIIGHYVSGAWDPRIHGSCLSHGFLHHMPYARIQALGISCPASTRKFLRGARVKEVRFGDTERFIICHNPQAAERDQHLREQLTAQLAELIADSDELSEFKRGELRGKIVGKPSLTCARSTTGLKSASAPTSSSAGSRCS